MLLPLPGARAGVRASVNTTDSETEPRSDEAATGARCGALDNDALGDGEHNQSLPNQP